MIRKIILFKIVVAFVFLTFFSVGLNAQDKNESCGFSLFMKWYSWKASTNLPEKQRLIVEYLKKADDIRNKTFETMFATTKSHYGYPDVKEAIKITEDALAELGRISAPKECRVYKKRSIEEVQHFLEYQKIRLKYGDGTKEFDKKHQALELVYSKRNLVSDVFSEFYICVKKAGLMNNMEEEIKNLPQE